MRKDIKKVKIVFTQHAIQRIGNRPWKDIFNGIREGKKEKLQEKKYKNSKYGEEQEGIFYRRFGSWVFTLKYVEDDYQPGEEMLLLITFTDQKENFYFST
jgi:hypothetical protein